MSKSSRPASAATRKERAAEIQRRQKDRERRLLMGGAALVVLVLVAIGLAVYRNLDQSSPSASPSPSTTPRQILPAPVTGRTTVQPAPRPVANPTSINGVLAWNTAGYPAPGTPDAGTLGHDHVPGPVRYAVTPPVGGPHNATWMNAGVYTAPVPPERAVHNLEHGAVWITYRPSLPAAQVTQLVTFFEKQSMIAEPSESRSNRYVDLTPWSSDALPSPIVISSWGYQLRVSSPTDPRLQQFVDTFRHSRTYTPEYGAPVDGIPVQTGGRPSVNGSSEPNPAGALG